VSRSSIIPRVGIVAAIAALIISACGGGTTSPSPTAKPSASAPTATSAAPSVVSTSAPAASTAAASPSASASASESTAVSPSASASEASASPSASGGTPSGLYTTTTCTGADQNQFFSEAECTKQLGLRTVKPTGDDATPWLQALNPVMVDTAKYKKDGPYKICVSESGEDNPWRVVGFKDMEHEATIQGVTLDHVIAGGKDDKQISDIADLIKNGNCSALIIAPNTTAALTPAVTQACASDVPIIVWDRGVTTDCPVTFIHPIGGYAFGGDAAEFLSGAVKPGGKIVALRILQGVDVLETRYLAAQAIFKQRGLNIVDTQFTGGDPAKTKQIVSDDIDKFGSIDGVWMDAGATSVAASEAFEDKGLPVPPITGEDQNDFLQKWKAKGYDWAAPTYPTYQWRTAIIAAVDILKGQQVPKEWILPQPFITKDNLDQYIFPETAANPLFYALCGCKDMPGFPADWLK
jgi:ribose transport system substrate-binding protein